MHANPSPRLKALYQRALVCRTFPAYRLSDLGPGEPASEILQAMQLLDIATKVVS